MAGKKKRRIELSFNPQSSALDGVILAKLDALSIPANHLVKMLLVNFLARQAGGLGLSDDEQPAFLELSPRFARRTPPKKLSGKLQRKVSIPPNGGKQVFRQMVESKYSAKWWKVSIPPNGGK